MNSEIIPHAIFYKQFMSKAKKQTIDYSTEELKVLSEERMTFLSLIGEKGWMKMLYGNDMEFNMKLQFVRFWWRDNTKPLVKAQKVDKFGQTKLL